MSGTGSSGNKCLTLSITELYRHDKCIMYEVFFNIHSFYIKLRFLQFSLGLLLN